MKYTAQQAQEGTTRPTQIPFFNRQTGSNAVVQTKLTVGSANDAHEHEANQTADMVMRKPENSVKNGAYTEGSYFTPTITPVIQRACAHCEQDKEQTAQRKEMGAETGGFTAPPSVSRAISSAGQGLDSNAKTFMESRFNRSFESIPMANLRHLHAIFLQRHTRRAITSFLVKDNISQILRAGGICWRMS
jgi:hypothetical protein